MIYLLASILCSVSVSVLLKLARKNKIDVAQAVAVNYIVAVALTAWVLKPDLSNPKAFLPTWWLFGALGVLLPSVFVIMGKAVDAAGIVKSDAAQRLSLILPIISAFVIFGEALTEGRLAGVWAGYGIIDILFKQLAKSGAAFSGNLLVAFSLAGILMFGYLFSQSTKWTKEGVIGGIILGGLNFANIVTYITAHQMMKDNPTLVFAGMNIGVIVLGTLVGAMAFKEKISSINAAGISVAVCAIACLFYWPQIRGLVGM